MIEKMSYMAPEAEIICFAPAEGIANDLWGTWGLRDTGTGGTLNGSSVGGFEDQVDPTENTEVNEGEEF